MPGHPAAARPPSLIQRAGDGRAGCQANGDLILGPVVFGCGYRTIKRRPATRQAVEAGSRGLDMLSWLSRGLRGIPAGQRDGPPGMRPSMLCLCPFLGVLVIIIIIIVPPWIPRRTGRGLQT